MASELIEVELMLSETGEARDRLKRLQAQTAFNGIDFVEVVGPAAPGETELWVHFINSEPEVEETFSELRIVRAETQTPVLIAFPEDAWGLDVQGRPLLRVRASLPDDPGPYTLTVLSSILDPYFEQASFSLMAGAVSDTDCAAPPVYPPQLADLPPIDYLAKDFLSFRSALLDFSALRYPEWQERSEADFGVMFLEALCALADDLSYTQDRIAAESSLETATQRRSLVRHARLLDYEPRPQTAARVFLQFDVTADGFLPSGLLVNAQRPDGPAVPFETGTGLHDPNKQYVVRARWNRGEMIPYLWDRSQACLPAGATQMWIRGHGFSFTFGQRLLIETAGETLGDPPLRQIVYLTASREARDPLYEDAPVTRIVWQPEDALERDRDLRRTVLAGNFIPATQGRRAVETFAVAPPPTGQPHMPLAVWRTGPNGVDQYLYPLLNGALAWLPAEDGEGSLLPEITLVQGNEGKPLQWNGPRWQWVRSLLEASSFETAFTIDPAQFRVIGMHTLGASVMRDYDGGGGDTIRFGDGVFGEIPASGTAFQVTYRAGGGAIGNVAPDSITQVAPGTAATPAFDPALIRAVTNPFAAEGGADQERAEQVRRRAPYAFRDNPLRAVLSEDYEKASKTLPWVGRAGARSRWVGSWSAVFMAADSLDGAALSESRAWEFGDLLNRRRLAGRAVYALTPRYVPLVLRLFVQAQADAFRSEVRQAILAALGPARPAEGGTGFFNDSFFTFGTSLDRAVLTAVVQSVPGVADLLAIQYRRLDLMDGFVDLPPLLTVGADQILRVANAPRLPDQGGLIVSLEGGK